jgi:biofilm PGA synthesis protein PgaA
MSLKIEYILLAGMAILTLFAGAADATEGGAVGTVDAANAAYRNAVEDARAGRSGQALNVLRPLVERFPRRQDLLGDYAVVLGWAGDHATALALLDRIDRATAPSHVLEGLAGSARATKQFELAETLYREAMARFPERLEPPIGLARTLADAGKLDAASALIVGLRAKHPRRIDVLEAAADIATARRDYFGALAAWQAILAQQPAHRGALRGKIQTLSRLGAPQLAIELADRNPGVLTPDERGAVAADRTAHRIRWGAIAADTGRGATRFADLDRALADSEMAGARALDPAAELTAIERQLALDRVSALRERYRMRDAVALHAALAARPAAMPAYAKSAAASAYLYLEQPEQARDLYRQALATDPDNLESRIGLFYALAESEDHDAARAQIDGAVAITPQWIDAWSPATIRENPAYARVLSASAMAPLFANRPGEAEQRLHELSDRAPYNMDVRTDYASSMRARGWPRAAEQELRWVLAVEPDNSGALGERAGALLEMRDYRTAESALASAQAVAAEDGRVVRAGRLWQVHNMRELVVDATFGRSGGGPTGTRDYAVDTHLYSSPFDYNYRAFGHLYNAEAKFDNGTGRRNRAGVGLEYRSPLIAATGELSHDLDKGKTGAAASLAFTPDDHWTLRGTLDTSANETPLQARLAGIDARRGSGEIVWQAHESRSAALSQERMEFSDGNRRDITQARWTERVIAGPVYKLEITGALYASRNSLAAAPYFNPSRDFSPTLEFANEWLQWRRYTRAFRHRLVVSVGNYWQQGFGTGPVHGARYEQEWTADDRLTLRYGIGRSLHPYDGAQTAHNYGYFNLNWRF